MRVTTVIEIKNTVSELNVLSTLLITDSQNVLQLAKSNNDRTSYTVCKSHRTIAVLDGLKAKRCRVTFQSQGALETAGGF